MKEAQYRAQAALEEAHWWHRGKLRIVRALLGRVARPGALVAELGCGTGGNLGGLSDAYDCVGADPSEEAVSLARRRFPRVAFLCGPVPDVLGQALGRAEAVLLLDVLEHVRDDRALLDRAIRGAKPGAHVILTVPADMRLWSRHDESLGHFRRYDREGFAALWRGLPVEQRLLSHYNARLYPVARLARAMSRWFGRPWGAADTDVGRVPGPLNRLLETVFAGEAGRLIAVLEGRGRGYGRGVSLIAVLRRVP